MIWSQLNELQLDLYQADNYSNLRETNFKAH